MEQEILIIVPARPLAFRVANPGHKVLTDDALEGKTVRRRICSILGSFLVAIGEQRILLASSERHTSFL